MNVGVLQPDLQRVRTEPAVASDLDGEIRCGAQTLNVVPEQQVMCSITLKYQGRASCRIHIGCAKHQLLKRPFSDKVRRFACEPRSRSPLTRLPD